MYTYNFLNQYNPTCHKKLHHLQSDEEASKQMCFIYCVSSCLCRTRQKAKLRNQRNWQEKQDSYWNRCSLSHHTMSEREQNTRIVFQDVWNGVIFFKREHRKWKFFPINSKTKWNYIKFSSICKEHLQLISLTICDIMLHNVSLSNKHGIMEMGIIVDVIKENRACCGVSPCDQHTESTARPQMCNYHCFN